MGAGGVTFDSVESPQSSAVPLEAGALDAGDSGDPEMAGGRMPTGVVVQSELAVDAGADELEEQSGLRAALEAGTGGADQGAELVELQSGLGLDVEYGGLEIYV